jgi:peptidoglycan/LPS O-acetylase OafA/YrhL
MTSTASAEEDRPSRGDKRLATLDFLRAVAVLMVIGAHLPAPTSELPWLVGICINTLRRNGGLGVDLFFVLSGFLIGGLLFREYQKYGEISFQRFFCRRGLKIYPPFLVLVAFYVVGHLAASKPVEISRVLAEICFVQNYFLGLWQHTWSLAVEEHFYLMLPWILILFVRVNPRKADPFRHFPALFVVLALTVLCLRWLTMYLRPEVRQMTHWFPTHLRIDALMFGVVCSYGFHFHYEAFRRFMLRFGILMPLLGIALLATYFVLKCVSGLANYTLGVSSYYLGCGIVLSYLIVANPRGGPIFRWMAWLGAFSYSIYLWHVPVNVGLESLMQRFPDRLPYLVWVAVTYLISLVVGVVMAKLVEYPVLRIRDRFFPSRSGTLHAVPQIP